MKFQTAGKLLQDPKLLLSQSRCSCELVCCSAPSQVLRLMRRPEEAGPKLQIGEGTAKPIGRSLPRSMRSADGGKLGGVVVR